ncbi:hypothetical protein K8R66_00075, partial [bacterium]|nr:hypothetical protein [bacterium]
LFPVVAVMLSSMELSDDERKEIIDLIIKYLYDNRSDLSWRGDHFLNSAILVLKSLKAEKEIAEAYSKPDTYMRLSLDSIMTALEIEFPESYLED